MLGERGLKELDQARQLSGRRGRGPGENSSLRSINNSERSKCQLVTLGIVVRYRVVHHAATCSFLNYALIQRSVCRTRRHL